jgi:hypothetical protein
MLDTYYGYMSSIFSIKAKKIANSQLLKAEYLDTRNALCCVFKEILP